MVSKMTHVLLIQPNSGYEKRDFSLTLGALGGSLKEAGHRVSYILFDMPWNRDWQVKKSLKGVDLVGITVSSCDFDEAVKILKQIRELNTDIPLIAGGAHATFAPDSLLEEGFDLCVQGEGEYTILEVAAAFTNESDRYQKLADISGISYWNEREEITYTPDRPINRNLDSLPLPDWQQDDYQRIIKEYCFPEKEAESGFLPDSLAFTFMIESSRGCPYGCVFCTTSKIKGKRWRGKSVKRILQEYAHFRDFYQQVTAEEMPGNKILVRFPDDNFCFNSQRAEDFCHEVLKMPDKERPLWSMMARANKVKEMPLMEKVKEAGCIRIFMGAECGYEEGLRKIKKGITLEMIRRAVDTALRIDFPVLIVSWIVGFPFEKKHEAMRTVIEALKIALKNPLMIRTSIFTFTPIVGADITELIGEHNRGQISNHDRSDRWGFDHPHLDDDDLFELQMVARWLVHLIDLKYRLNHMKDQLKSELAAMANSCEGVVVRIENEVIRRVFLQIHNFLKAHLDSDMEVVARAVLVKIPDWLHMIEQDLPEKEKKLA